MSGHRPYRVSGRIAGERRRAPATGSAGGVAQGAGPQRTVGDDTGEARITHARASARRRRMLPEDGGVWTAAGMSLAVVPPRMLVLLTLVIAATVFASFPVLAVLVLPGVVAFAVALAAAVARWTPHRLPLAQLLVACRRFARSPWAAVELTAWEAGSLLARLGAAAAIAAALGVAAPLSAALVIVPALELASLAPLTPGNGDRRALTRQ
jgi:hypothetical protein